MEFEWKNPQLVASSYNRDPLVRYGMLMSEELTAEETDGELGELRSTDPNYSSDEVEAAKLMVNQDVRHFVLRLAKLRKMPSQEVEHEAEADIVERLLDKGLIAEEYLLQCKQNNQTICVIPDKEHVTQEPMASVRCNTCDRPFPEERLQTIYTLTGQGKRIVDGSLWMSIWITELLKEIGIQGETIKWALEARGEDLDMMVEDFDSRIFFELKDREFGLGDAYPFVNRINRYGGSLGVVATMDQVATDAKQFFDEEAQRRDGSARIRYLEGPETIQRGIVELLESLSQRQIRRRLVIPFATRVGFDLWPLVEQWMETVDTKKSTDVATVTS